MAMYAYEIVMLHTVWILIIFCYTISAIAPDNYKECLQSFKESVIDPNGSLYTNTVGYGDCNHKCSTVSWYEEPSSNESILRCFCERYFSWAYIPDGVGSTSMYSIEVQGLGLSGAFPKGLIKNCSDKLTILNLSHNKFKGPIPRDHCDNLPSLQYLDLSYNDFNGSIPASLGSCKQLKELHLQGNKFSGFIPQEIGSLPRLISINLSSNSLSGEIPCSLLVRNQQADFDASCFANNDMLKKTNCKVHHGISGRNKTLVIVLSVVIAALIVASILLYFLPSSFSCVNCCSLYWCGGICSHKKTIWPENHVQMAERHIVKLSHGNLLQATANFSSRNVIGRGGSSTVYRGVFEDGRVVAVKRFHSNISLLRTRENSNTIHDQEDMEECQRHLNVVKEQFLTEVDVLGKLKHRNLAKIVGYCYSTKRKNSMAIVLTYMPKGSLEKVLDSRKALQVNWKARLKILVGIGEALAYLHNEYDKKTKVIHGDLKPANVLLDRDLEAHISDFGISVMTDEDGSTTARRAANYSSLANRPWSVGYTAPECLLQGTVSTKSDVYSFGVIILEVITGRKPSSPKLKDGQTLCAWTSNALRDVSDSIHRYNTTVGAVASSSTSNCVSDVDGDRRVMLIQLLVQREMLARTVLPLYIKFADDVTSILRLGCACASLDLSRRPPIHDSLPFLRSLLDKATTIHA